MNKEKDLHPPLLFLDFDGVLISRQSIIMNRGDFSFCPIALSNLTHIVDHTKCKIVVTSSWRKTRSLEQLQNLFKEPVRSSILSKTIASRTPRYLKIRMWIKANYFSLSNVRYAILDDKEPMDTHGKNFFPCNSDVGLDFPTTVHVIEHLTGKPYDGPTIIF